MFALAIWGLLCFHTNRPYFQFGRINIAKMATLPQMSYRFGAAAAANSLQSCPTLPNPIDGSTPGSPVPGILQARTVEWVAISFSNAWKWKVKVKSLSRVRLLTTPWTAAYQAPCMGFSRQEYWSGLPLPSPTDSGQSLLNCQLYFSLNYRILQKCLQFVWKFV